MISAVCIWAASTAFVLHEPVNPAPGWVHSSKPVDKSLNREALIALHRRNTDKLDIIAKRVSNPNDEMYLVYPDPKYVQELLAPSEKNVELVTNWLTSAGAKILHVHPGRDELRVSATLDTWEKLLSSSFTNLVHKQKSLFFPVLSKNVVIPDHLSGVIQLITGLHTTPLMKSAQQVRERSMAMLKAREALAPHFAKADPSRIQPVPNLCLGAGACIDPPTILGFSSVPDVISRPKNLQAIAQFEGEDVSDSLLKVFGEAFGAGAVQYKGNNTLKVSAYIPTRDHDPDTDGGVESMLDIDYITSLGGNAETWVYTPDKYTTTSPAESEVEGKLGGSFDAFCKSLLVFSGDVRANATSGDPYPTSISISYGTQHNNPCGNQYEGRWNDDMKFLASVGISVLISSGDDGSGYWCRGVFNNKTLYNSFPSNSPWVSAIGGTYFHANVTGNNYNPVQQATTQFGSGGGFTSDYPQPDYQKKAVESFLANTIVPPTPFNRTGRATPDFSLFAESYAVVTDQGVISVGGTSASSPASAGLITLLNSVCGKASSEGNLTLGHLNPLFYQLAAENPLVFQDVTIGDNGVFTYSLNPNHHTSPCSTDSSWCGFYAEKGWDAVTGLGTPNFSQLSKEVKKKCADASMRRKTNYGKWFE